MYLIITIQKFKIERYSKMELSLITKGDMIMVLILTSILSCICQFMNTTRQVGTQLPIHSLPILLETKALYITQQIPQIFISQKMSSIKFLSIQGIVFMQKHFIRIIRNQKLISITSLLQPSLQTQRHRTEKLVLRQIFQLEIFLTLKVMNQEFIQFLLL